MSGIDNEEKFWALFHEKLMENGEPFSIFPEGAAALIGEERAGKCSILAELDLSKKVLRVGLRVDSSHQEPYIDRFQIYQKELEALLKETIHVAFSRPSYGYCGVMQFFVSSQEEGDREAAIERAIVKISLYQTLIPQYLAKPVRKVPSPSAPQPIPPSNPVQSYDDCYREPQEDYVILKTTEDRVRQYGGSIYEATRQAWVASFERIRQYRYVFGVIGGVVKGVYIVDKWYLENDEKHGVRCAFHGHDAPQEFARRFLGKCLPSKYMKPGSANPVQYKK